ncbi:MAG: TlpA disulfide reductase family protein [Bacteroidales bacterium]|nr:TlpA disulfide reductase family protein [Bacteroidales bacterium]
MKNTFRLYSIFIICSLTFISSFAKATELQITLLGVKQSNIYVYSIAESKNNLIQEFKNVKKDKTISIDILDDYLPGEFIVYFEWMPSPQTQKPQTAERMIILNDKDIKFYANPLFINNQDSSYFSKNDIENKTLTDFVQSVVKNIEMLDILKTFLLSYDNSESDVYEAGKKEFSQRCTEHNKWIDKQIKEHKDLFCSNMFYFYYVPNINWKGNTLQQQQSIIDNYFVGMDFSNKEILRVSYLKNWLDTYVNEYIKLATSYEMVNSLFITAGQTAIEKAKEGDPYFYGWMVDYFFNGYESMNIQEGITMLEQYMKDPKCMTHKRKEIEKRVNGIQSLQNGVLAPDFTFIDASGQKLNLHDYNTDAPYKLVLFWSADCEYCHEIIAELYEWNLKNKSKLKVFAVSLDESETEIPKWELEKERLNAWTHILTKGGVNSTEANAYYILSTPTMFLIDSCKVSPRC